jgi:TPR repeat protein
LSHPPSHIAGGGQAYPTHLPSAAPESLTSGSPDSGHLLGAAGLGLIGGIALAGVLAVFVFNSFIDENDPTNSEPAPKVVERLQPPPAVTENAPAPVRIEVPPAAKAGIPAAVPPTPAASPPPPARAERIAPAPAQPEALPRQAARTEAPAVAQKLSARNASGATESPIKLDIRVADASDKDESLISLKGLPPEAKLSTGIDVGGGQWLLPPARLKDLTVTLPKGASGDFGLEVQLLKDDAQTSLSDSVSFSLKVNPKRQESTLAVPSTGTTASPEQAARLAVLPDETPQIETDFLTQMLIRDGNRLMRDGDIAAARRLYEQAAGKGNAEAALAMGRSYDPSYFEKLTVKTGKPDPATAFEWYKKALEGGLVTARVKIDALKQWLQR